MNDVVNYLSLSDDILTGKSKIDIQQQYKLHKSDWVEQQISFDEYVKFANRLATTNVDYNTILGYVATTESKESVYCKYNKKTENFVVYVFINGTPSVVTFFKKSWRDYNGDKCFEYCDEIQLGK